MYIRVTKEFKFEMAHALLNHDGPCKNIHGHSYQLAVTFIGKPLQDENDPKAGMVADFSDIKKIITDEIIKLFDHALVLNKATAKKIYAGMQEQKLVLVNFQPTCENMIGYIVQKLQQVLPSKLLLHHLLLRETSSSYAEWYATDNS